MMPREGGEFSESRECDGKSTRKPRVADVHTFKGCPVLPVPGHAARRSVEAGLGPWEGSGQQLSSGSRTSSSYCAPSAVKRQPGHGRPNGLSLDQGRSSPGPPPRACSVATKGGWRGLQSPGHVPRVDAWRCAYWAGEQLAAKTH